MNKIATYLVASFLILFLFSIRFSLSAQNPCKADFIMVRDSIINIPYVYFFEEESTAVDTNIVSWSWDFGDNNKSTDRSVLHQYNKPGTYTVCLSIATKNNCHSDTCKTLIITEVPTCKSSFYYYNFSNDSLNTSNSTPNTFYFTDLSGGNIKNWLWHFGDGSTSTLQNPVHTFNPGTYKVCLNIEGTISGSTNLCQDLYCQSITINQSASCFANFFNVPDGVSATTFHFYDSSQGYPGLWFWSFGDDSTSSARNPVHNYAKPGNYKVCLTIVNDTFLCKDMRCYDFYAGASPIPCEAAFNYLPDTAANANTTIDFINISKGNALKFLWNFGDGDISTEADPHYSFPHTGVFNVCLSISDSLGKACNDQYCRTVFIGDKPSSCQAFFVSEPDTMALGKNFYKFTDMSAGYPSSWHWDFGDNSTDNSQNPEHQYANPGTYYPCLTIHNDYKQCQNIYCSRIFVPGNSDNCLADFSYQNSNEIVSVPSARAYQFLDLSQSPSLKIHSSFWQFGDGSSSDEANPAHIFFPGTYKVCLTISSAPINGAVCSDTRCYTLTVDSIISPPLSSCNNYITNDNDPKDSLTVHFYGSSRSTVNYQPSTKFIWAFGNGDTIKNTSDIHGNSAVTYKYKKGGTYNVRLTTIDSLNCTFTSSRLVFVNTSQGFGSVEGQVFANGKNVDKAKVLIVSLNSSPGSLLPNPNSFSYLDSNNVDSIGGYHFSKVPYGQYYVLSYLQPTSKYFSSFLPAFYGNTWYWADATTVTLTKNSSSGPYNLNLISYKNFTTGPGIIKGFVSYGGIQPSGSTLPAQGSLYGIEILLFDNSGNTLAYTYTDSHGQFSFSALAYGTYRLNVEILGVYTASAYVTLSPENPEADNIGFNVDYGIMPFITSLSVHNYQLTTNNEQLIIGDVYPNPLSDIANIPVHSLRQSLVTLTVYDQFGQKLTTNNEQLTSGISLLHLSTSSLSKGVYYVSISSKDGFQSTKKFVKID